MCLFSGSSVSRKFNHNNLTDLGKMKAIMSQADVDAVPEENKALFHLKITDTKGYEGFRSTAYYCNSWRS